MGCINLRSLAFFASITLAIGCAPGEPEEGQSSSSSTASGFKAGQTVSDCLTSDTPGYNACVVYKNPVFSNGAAFVPPLDMDNSPRGMADSTVTYAVNIPGGKLENAHYRIEPTGAGFLSSALIIPQALPVQGEWKFSFLNDGQHRLAQVNSYYWLNRQRDFMIEKSGQWYASNKDIKVLPITGELINNAIWTGKEFNFIAMGVIVNTYGAADWYTHFALSADVVAHEAAHANMDYANDQDKLAGPHEVSCNGLSTTLCCRDGNGCFRAIHEGLADLHSFILFPENTAISELFSNSSEGIDNCGLPRDADEAIRNPASTNDYFGACDTPEVPNLGQIHAMGTVIASIWWDVREKAKSRGQSQVVDQILSEHLLVLTKNDNFTSQYEVIESVAQRVAPAEAAQILADFRQGYERMGVALP